MELLLFILFILFGPALILALIGASESRKGRKQSAKILYIIAGVYVLISLGTCGWLLNGFGSL